MHAEAPRLAHLGWAGPLELAQLLGWMYEVVTDLEQHIRSSQVWLPEAYTSSFQVAE
jgi:hypothetical protein